MSTVLQRNRSQQSAEAQVPAPTNSQRRRFLFALGAGGAGAAAAVTQALAAPSTKRGRPTLGSAAASVESVRLDPELRHQLAQRARHDNTTTSEIIREALRQFLHAA